MLMILYLRGAISFKFLDNIVTLKEDRLTEEPVILRSASFSPDIEQRLTEIATTVEQLKSAQLDALAGNREELIAALRPTLPADIAKELESRFVASAIDAATINEIRRSFESAYQRLQLELSSLTRRSNLNLVIGVLTTVIAVLLLSYMVLVLGTNGTFASLTALLSHYVPRVAVVLFIEVFSFFFLRLYRSTLAEMRSYQEDIIALAQRQVAIEMAWTSSDPTARASLAKELVAVSATTRVNAKENKELSVDPELVTELLQKFAKVLAKKEK